MSMTLSRTDRGIVIVMPGTPSEVIMALPMANAIRDAFPNSPLTWIASTPARRILDSHGSADHVIYLPNCGRSSRRLLETLRPGLRSALRSTEADLAIDVQGSVLSGLVCWMTGAPTRIGFTGRRRGPLGRWFHTKPVEAVFSHQTDRALELLTPLGIHHPKVEWRLATSQSDERWAEQWRQGFGNRPVAMISPTGGQHAGNAAARMQLPRAESPARRWRRKRAVRESLARRRSRPFTDPPATAPRIATENGPRVTAPPAGRARRHWEPNRFVATARYLHRNHGYHTVVCWETFAERLVAEQVVADANDCLSLAPAVNFEQLAALLGKVDLFIGVDGVPMHLAVAAGTPTIGLFSDTSPTDRGPYGQIALERAKRSRFSRSRTAPTASRSSSVGVSVRDVCDAADTLHDFPAIRLPAA